MLENHFTVSEAAKRLRSCVLAAYLGDFCALLMDRGYRAASIRHKLWVLSFLASWMTKQPLAVVDLSEHHVDKFVDARRRSGRTCRGFRSTALLLLEQLRSRGVVAASGSTQDDSPANALLDRYESYLRQERALAESTISAYLSFVREFVVNRLDDGAVRPDSLRPGDIRDFLLARVRRLVPKRVQFMGTALRSFLRYLFLCGETDSDLAAAVPTVRQWRQADVPRHISGRDVERLLQACDRSGATGRRDYVILLLLARLGLRASEIVTLELNDLNWRTGEIAVRGKGLVRDRLPLPADVGEALALYLQKDRPTSTSRRVFLRRCAPHRGFANPSTVSTIVARALDRAGLAPATRGAHLLRHSLATAMVRRGASLTEVGQVLRHRSPNTTEIYVKLDFDALREVAMPWPTARGAR
jgi:site-specific recombinase XerD